jgi:hypothetical protein
MQHTWDGIFHTHHDVSDRIFKSQHITLIFMNLRFGLNLTDTNAVPSNTNMDAMKYPPVPATPASSAGGEGGLPSSADMVRHPWQRPNECPQAMVDSATSQWDAYQSTLSVPKSVAAVRNPRVDTFAVAMIATGKASEKRNVERCIQSLRRRGQYDGRVLIITEQETRYSTLEKSDDQITILHIDNSTLHFELKEKMPFKRLKSEVLDLMDTKSELDGYSHVVYIDIDIVIGDRLDDFLAYVEQRTKRAEEKYVIQAGDDTGMIKGSTAKKSFMMMFEEQGGGIEKAKHKTKLIWHSGVTVLHREHSRECLNVWRSVIDSNRFKRDQTCLYYMYYTNMELRSQCEILRMDDKAYFYIPTEETMALGTSAVFVHNTNTGRAKKIHKQVQYDYYRCSMMLDDAVMKDDILSLKRKGRLAKKEKGAGLVWDGFELKKETSAESKGKENGEDDGSEDGQGDEVSEEEKEIAELEAESLSTKSLRR